MPNRAKCETHLKQENLEYNKTNRKIGSTIYNWAWRKARTKHLRSHPLCVKCEANGRKQIATEVDHIIPHNGDKQQFWDSTNWQSLCKSCHSKKTIREWNK